MPKVVAIICFLTLLSACLALPEAAPSTAEEDIAATLNAQVEAWNRGDLEGFMQGYWNSPELTFSSGGVQTKGWQPTLERYRRRYQSAGSEMGKLSFDDLQITMLASESAFVRGRWRLTMSDGKKPGGLFTLILQRRPQGWRIMHDHTSAECSQ